MAQPSSDELLSTTDERAMLEGFLDEYRAVIVAKVRGVSEQDAQRRLVPSMTTLAGLVKHLRWVEQSWFQRGIAQRPAADVPVPPYTDDDPDGDFRVEPGETVEQLIADYERECARSRTAGAGRALTDLVPHPRHGDITVRWIYVHMIEETARHAGHADILRELIDGSTGDGDLPS
ncbi:DinB family protein [Solihabitans fulvus]|uniref:DinB family protein n=1 Tax=Solihabitans fulvus TaxID=1892852 RepID=A0A5B2XEW0_9PSEU|nr:DinB family protein [Solihabitans fulvus]KAA2261786.1 DinB family protein [Solihabitans fulvus]